MVWLLRIYTNHHRQPIKQHKRRTIILLVRLIRSLWPTDFYSFAISETNMYVSSAKAPYEGVYQRQPTGLPRPEYVPQHPDVPSAPPAEFNQPNMYPPMPNGYQPAMQYPPQAAYQNNAYGGSMYVPQMPPSYEQSQHDIQQKKRD